MSRSTIEERLSPGDLLVSKGRVRPAVICRGLSAPYFAKFAELFGFGDGSELPGIGYRDLAFVIGVSHPPVTCSTHWPVVAVMLQRSNRISIFYLTDFLFEKLGEAHSP